MARLVTLLFLVVLAQACTLRVREPSSEEKNQLINEVLVLTDEIRAAAEAADADGLFRYHSDAPDAAHIIDGKRFVRSEMVSNYRGVYAGVASQQINIGNPSVKILAPDLVLVVSQGDFTTRSKSGGALSGDVAWTYLWQKKRRNMLASNECKNMPAHLIASGFTDQTLQ